MHIGGNWFELWPRRNGDHRMHARLSYSLMDPRQRQPDTSYTWKGIHGARENRNVHMEQRYSQSKSAGTYRSKAAH